MSPCGSPFHCVNYGVSIVDMIGEFSCQGLGVINQFGKVSPIWNDRCGVMAVFDEQLIHQVISPRYDSILIVVYIINCCFIEALHIGS